MQWFERTWGYLIEENRFPDVVVFTLCVLGLCVHIILNY